MSETSVPPACTIPHHGGIVFNAEIAAMHLRGWAMILDALLELSRISTYPRESTDGVGMVLSHALSQMAESLTPPADPVTTTAPAPPTGNGAGLHVVRPDSPGELLGDD